MLWNSRSFTVVWLNWANQRLAQVLQLSGSICGKMLYIVYQFILFVIAKVFTVVEILWRRAWVPLKTILWLQPKLQVISLVYLKVGSSCPPTLKMRIQVMCLYMCLMYILFPWSSFFIFSCEAKLSLFTVLSFKITANFSNGAAKTEDGASPRTRKSKPVWGYKLVSENNIWCKTDLKN